MDRNGRGNFRNFFQKKNSIPGKIPDDILPYEKTFLKAGGRRARRKRKKEYYRHTLMVCLRGR
jgi:hypothetical protein